MGLILGLIGMHVAAVAVEKITDTVSDVSHNIRSRSRESAEIEVESRRYVAREQTKREVTLAQIEAETLCEIERTRAQARIMEARTRTGFFGSLYGRQNVGQIGCSNQNPYMNSSEYDYQNGYSNANSYSYQSGYSYQDDYSYPNESAARGEIVPTMRFCPYCGQGVKPSNRFCIRCGGRLQP